jgi:pimeloyl-ACP methyl ester carboxylesterase
MRKITFRVQGTGAAVLLLHGIPTCGRLWDVVVEILQHDFSFVIVDLPGMGESPPLTDCSPELSHYVSEVELIRKELSISAWHVVGHDAGSAIAVHYSAIFPDFVKKLVLCSPPIFPELRLPWAFRVLRTRLLGDVLAPFITPLVWHIGLPASLERHNERMSQIVAAFRRPFVGITGARRFVKLLRWGDPAQVLAQTAALLPKIAAPTLVLHGRYDETIPVDFATRAATLIPGASVRILDSGHFLPLNCPELLTHHLLNFLKGEFQRSPSPA